MPKKNKRDSDEIEDPPIEPQSAHTGLLEIDSDEVENPPIEPPGVRTDLLEHPDPEALALAASRSGTKNVELLLEYEDPPGEWE